MWSIIQLKARGRVEKRDSLMSMRGIIFFAMRCFFLTIFCGGWFLTGLLHAGEPQLDLPRTQLTLGAHSIEVQVASDDASRSKGLMFRTELPADEGMLFVFDRPQQAGFWMKNTPLPLSVAYISPEGRILEIHPLEPQSEQVITSRFRNILFALEMHRGWFEENKILPGDRILGLPSVR